MKFGSILKAAAVLAALAVSFSLGYGARVYHAILAASEARAREVITTSQSVVATASQSSG